MSVDRLCFGTSTFVAGRLFPDKDSRPGVAALVEALVAGVRLIHSNPNLGTQWAVREAFEAADRPAGVQHLVKVEAPLDAGPGAVPSLVERRLGVSAKELGVDRLHAAVIEVDLKHTMDRKTLVNLDAVRDFYQRLAEQAVATELVSRVYGYCHSPAHLMACRKVESIAGYAAQYNKIEAWPALQLDEIYAAGRPFLAMAPLRRGRLVDEAATTADERLRALRWVLAHPGISQAVITTSSVGHLTGVLQAARTPLPVAAVRCLADAWLTVGKAKPAADRDHLLTRMNALAERAEGGR